MPPALLLLTLVPLAVACSAPAAPGPSASSGDAQQPQYGGVLKVRVPGDPYDWDMSYTAKNGALRGYGLPYESLLSFRVGEDVPFHEAVLQPGLAESWQVSPDGKVFTFHLRNGVTFANLPPVNGRTMTSADVKWSYEYWSRTGQFEDVAAMGGREGGAFAYMLTGVDRIDTPDPSTAVVRFEQPFMPFLSYAGAEYIPVVPHEIYDADGDLKNRAVGTGAFQMDQQASQAGTRWVWKKNPDYWQQDKPYIDEIRWLVLPDEAAGLAAFQAGQLDYLGFGERLAYETAQQVRRSNPEAVMLEWEPPSSWKFWINTAQPPLDDVKVRRALALSVNPDEFIKTLQGGRGSWEIPFVFKGYFSDDEIRKLLPYDPQRARRILADAGYPDGVSLEITYPQDAGSFNQSHLELMQSQLKQTGFNVSLKALDAAAFSKNRKVVPPKYTINYVNALSSGRFDPDSVLFDFHSKNSLNYMGIKDPELDRLLEAQRQEVDPAKRRELIRDAGRRLADQAYVAAMETVVFYDFWRPRLQNFHPNMHAPGLPVVDAWLRAG